MDLQMSVMNLPTNLKLTAQHILNKDLEVTRYPINLTAIITSATSLKGALQVTRVNQKFTLLELGGEIKVGILWSWWHWEDSSKRYFRFYLNCPTIFQASSISFILFIFLQYVSPISLYSTSTRRKNKSPTMPPLSEVFCKRLLKV